MNKTVAFIGLGAAVCMTAPAFAQDTHLALTKESVASMHEITAALDKVTDEPGAADAVKTVKKVREKLVDLGKRQLELPGATPQEQAQISAQMTEVQKISGELVKSLARLKKEGLLFADNEKAINKLREYLPKDGFLRMSYEWYTKAMYPEIREVWSRYMKIIVDTIYKMNKPTTHKVKLTKIG